MKFNHNLSLIAVCVASAILISASLQAGPSHKKNVIGYITQWEAWKGPDAGFSVQGEATHLNVNMDIYSMLNFSFFGVAKDGSLHSGDLRNKLIYQEGAVQEPASLVDTDVYSSWDLHILWGELEYIHQYPGTESWEAATLAKVKAQGFVKDGNGWKHTPSGLTGNMPIPLKKAGGAPGLIDMGLAKGVKVMASIGGWSMSKHFPEMAKNPAMKERFLKDIDRLIGLGFQGIDIDWEYPGVGGMNFKGTPEDYKNFEQLMEDIRARIGKDKVLTAAFKALPSALEGFNWERLSKSMDYFNMMTYDFNGGWSNVTGHNSPLFPYAEEEFKGYTLDSLRIWMQKRGIPSDKINFGAAFYGRGVQTKEARAYLGAPTDKREVVFSVDGPTLSAVDLDNWSVFEGQPNYTYIQQQTGWESLWDDSARVPYALKGKYFLSYDDEKSIREKAQYVVDNALAGMIVWQVSGDIKCEGDFISYGPKLKKCTNLRSPLAEQIDAVFSATGIPNTAPVLTVPSAQTVNSEGKLSFLVSAVDAQGDTLTFSALGASVSSMENGKATVTYTAPKTEKDLTQSIGVSVSDGKLSVTKSVTVSVKGDMPATDTSWDPRTIYNTGDSVIHEGSKFTAQWWTQGDVPGKSEVWVQFDDGSVKEWSSGKIYNTDDKASYMGTIYTAKWWTKGDLPGSADVWVDAGGASDKEWKPGKVYNGGDKANYKGKKYQAKWWTQGDIPGIVGGPWNVVE